ncbi:MAG: hypothetical protein ACJ76F_12505 [Bacteroidia bacterium]
MIFLVFPAIAYTQATGTDEYNPKKEVTFDGKRYRVYNNYLTIGAGQAHSSYAGTQFVGALDFNFHLQKYYFQTGGMLSGDHFGLYNNVQAHLCLGKRFEQNRYNIAGYLGVSYSSTNRSYEDSVIHAVYIKKPGFYACVQTTYKYKYDLGIGLAFFADFNDAQSIYGLRLELFFSGAYRRAVKGKEQNLNQKPETYSE